MTDKEREKKIKELSKLIEECMFFELPRTAKSLVMRRDELIKGRSQRLVNNLEARLAAQDALASEIKEIKEMLR